jgi:DNA mismatch repair protein MutL
MINNKLQAQMACKAAVKAGDLLTQEKMEQLLHDLEKTANRFSCPHGRPTGWLLSLHEIEKKFKRRI